MLIVSYFISHLTIISQRQAISARKAEKYTAALHGLSKKLAMTRSLDELLKIALHYLADIF